MRFAGTQLGNFMDPTNFDNISISSLQGKGMERMYNAEAGFLVDKAGLDGESLIKQAEYGASATRAQGSAQGQAAMWGGISSGIGSLAGGFASKAGGTPKPTPVPRANTTPLQGASYLQPNAPTSLAGYQQALDRW